MVTILLLARAFREHAGDQGTRFEAAGHDVLHSPAAGVLSRDQLFSYLHADGVGSRVNAIVAGGEQLTADVLDQLPALRIIARWGIGYDMVDLAAASARGVYVTNTPGLLSESVADLAFGMMLALSRRLHVADRQVRSGSWETVYGVYTWRKSLGILGFGGIGQTLARRARGFDMSVTACDPYAGEATADALGVRLVELEEMLETSDYVSMHADLNDATRGVMDETAFARMKPGSYLISTARGGLVDEVALIAALESGRLAGAGLDARVGTRATGPPVARA
jgi:phosphoglycerate dehydrogenase-like enzyme